jgi:hypothetical protein
MAAGFIIGERCHQCSRFFAPSALHEWPGGVRVCEACLDNHRRAVQSIAGAQEMTCCECGVHARDLLDASGEGRMAIHAKDGIMQLLCPRCSDQYERKRLDLYGDTDYGRRKRLKGAK